MAGFAPTARQASGVADVDGLIVGAPSRGHLHLDQTETPQRPTKVEAILAQLGNPTASRQPLPRGQPRSGTAARGRHLPSRVPSVGTYERTCTARSYGPRPRHRSCREGSWRPVRPAGMRVVRIPSRTSGRAGSASTSGFKWHADTVELAAIERAARWRSERESCGPRSP